MFHRARVGSRLIAWHLEYFLEKLREQFVTRIDASRQPFSRGGKVDVFSMGVVDQSHGGQTSHGGGHGPGPDSSGFGDILDASQFLIAHEFVDRL